MSRPPTLDDTLDIPSLPSHKPSDNRHLGLVQVHPKTTDDKEISKKKVDIIFMHGLDAQSPKTWIAWVREDDPTSGNVNWLSDEHMLPAAMPDARILTYDWNGNYDRTASRERLVGHADALLERISRDREDFNRQAIPLMFVASCYSGLLLAQALVRATEPYLPRYTSNRKILDCVAGIAFLGTPFRGSWETGNLVASLRVEIAADAAKEYNRELIEYLRPGTRDAPSPLEDLVSRFTYMIRHEDFKFGIVCFYETRDTDFSPYRSKLPPSYAGQLDVNGHGIVVEQSSACLQGVDKVGLDVRHNMLHKFNSPQNEGFKHLTSRLKEFQSKAQLKLNKRAKLHDKCLDALYFGGINYEPGQIREASETTCQWMLEHPIYSTWHAEGHGVFWILGSPGSGKSTLIKHAIKKDQKLHGEQSTLVLSFFFQNQGKRLQHTVEGLLRGLLRQLLEKAPGQMHSFYNKLDTDAPKGLHDSRWNAPYLVQLFEEAVAAVLEHVNIRIFVDALDECRVGDEDDTQEIEDLVQKLRDMEESMRAKPQSLSICFACRHFPQLASLNKDPYIKTEWENGGAIEEYVEGELLRITGDDQLRSNLQTEIIQSANGNFLWASWVTREAIKLHRKGLPVEEIIRNTPGQLSTIYDEILRRLSRETSGMSLKLFQWLCLAEMPLSLRDFCFASGIDVQERKFTSFKELFDVTEDDGPPRLKSLIRTLSGGLAEVDAEENDVVLIHQSVKDFLIKDGFKILDPEQDTHQKVMTSGHGLLLSSCLWSLTETELSGMVLHWMETFDPAIIAIVSNMQLDRDIFQPLDEVELSPAPDARGAVKALSSSDRDLVRGVLSELAGIFESCSPHHREGMVFHDLENWTLADEIYACLVLYVYLLAHQPSFMLFIYARGSWVHHALRAADNGGLLTAQSEIRKFCSRLKPEYSTIYNNILGVLHVTAGIQASWVLEELLAHKSNNILDVNSLSGELGITPLMEAIRNGRAKKIQMLLDHEDIDVNTMSFNGQTALFSAVDTNCYGIVEQLIKQGADLDIQDVEGETVLMFAVDDDQYEIMNLLLDNGASIHLESLNNVNAINGATDRCLDGLARFIVRKIRRQEKEIWGDR